MLTSASVYRSSFKSLTYDFTFCKVNFRWQRGNKIGEGQYGKVYACVNIDTGQLMAMKCIRLSTLDHKTIKSVTEEIKIIEGFSHPNLVKYFGVELHSDELLLFMEVGRKNASGFCIGLLRDFFREMSLEFPLFSPLLSFSIPLYHSLFSSFLLLFYSSSL